MAVLNQDSNQPSGFGSHQKLMNVASSKPHLAGRKNSFNTITHTEDGSFDASRKFLGRLAFLESEKQLLGPAQ